MRLIGSEEFCVTLAARRISEVVQQRKDFLISMFYDKSLFF